MIKRKTFYLDIHTHHFRQNDANHIFIYNLIAGKDPCDLRPDYFYSCGIHPWYLSGLEQKWEILLQNSDLPQMIALGECGLDFQKKILAKYPESVQKEIFIRQIQWAEKIKKPLIIHCVKCFHELLNIRKNHSGNRWIIHGFDKNKEIAKQLIDAGIYLSFGAGIIKHPATAQALSKVPLHQIFLETDDQEEFSIEEIYQKASEIRGIEVEKLSEIILKNAKKVFGINFQNILHKYN